MSTVLKKVMDQSRSMSIAPRGEQDEEAEFSDEPGLNEIDDSEEEDWEHYGL
jgi:hypothetical protein